MSQLHKLLQNDINKTETFHFTLQLDRIMYKLILVFVLYCINLSDACSCIQIVKKDAYCNSGFSGLIKVTNSGTNCGTMKICYSIVLVHQFRGNPITPAVLETNNQSAACGVNLTQGHTYFVSTNAISSNKIGLNLCQFKEDWTGLSACEFLLKTLEYIRISCLATPATQIKAELAKSKNM